MHLSTAESEQNIFLDNAEGGESANHRLKRPRSVVYSLSG